MATRNLQHVIAALSAVGMKSRSVGRVEFFHDEYYLSHGHLPRGFGSWAFEPMRSGIDVEKLRGVIEAMNAQPAVVGRASVDQPGDGRVVVWMPCSTYGEAKSAAARLFAAFNACAVQVCS